MGFVNLDRFSLFLLVFYAMSAWVRIRLFNNMQEFTLSGPDPFRSAPVISVCLCICIMLMELVCCAGK